MSEIDYLTIFCIQFQNRIIAHFAYFEMLFDFSNVVFCHFEQINLNMIFYDTFLKSVFLFAWSNNLSLPFICVLVSQLYFFFSPQKGLFIR